VTVYSVSPLLRSLICPYPLFMFRKEPKPRQTHNSRVLRPIDKLDEQSVQDLMDEESDSSRPASAAGGDATQPPPALFDLSNPQVQAFMTMMANAMGTSLGTVLQNLNQAAPTPATATTSTSQPRENAQIREPTLFEGNSPGKLQSFISDCNLAFRARPTTYATDTAKVNFALQYLSGTARDLFRPDLEENPPPSHLASWKLFTEKLEERFGFADPEAEAETRLEALQMTSSQRVTNYIIKFDALSSKTKWNEPALRRRFYDGLVDRLKDDLSRMKRISKVADLKTAVNSLDQRYWEGQEEISRTKSTASQSSGQSSRRNQGSGGSGGSSNNATASNSSSSNRPSTSASANPSTHSSNNSSRNNHSRNSSLHSNSNSHSRNNSSNRPSQSSSRPANNKPDLTGKITDQGHLTPEEHAKRVKSGCCLYCGDKGHTVKECPKAKARNEAKGRAGTASTSATPADPAPAGSSAPKN
jgi:hypothetical protein